MRDTLCPASPWRLLGSMFLFLFISLLCRLMLRTVSFSLMEWCLGICRLLLAVGMWLWLTRCFPFLLPCFCTVVGCTLLGICGSFGFLGRTWRIGWGIFGIWDFI